LIIAASLVCLLPTQDIVGKFEQGFRLAQGFAEVGGADVEEAVVGGVLEVDRLAELSCGRGASWSYLSQQGLRVMVIGGAGAFAQRLAACGV
jgi:hypothetical protein